MNSTPSLSDASLLEAARHAAARAYAPYSRFPVGAALLADDGRTITGVNIENSSFGLTVCAERCALFAAVAAGIRGFAAIALVTPTPSPATPCGACRQVLAEFCRPDLRVLCGTHDPATPHVAYRLRDLLPHTFQFPQRPDAPAVA